MTIQRGKQVKIVSAANAEDFETKLNATLRSLNAKGIKYELQMSLEAGLIAYVIYEEQKYIPETIKDEFELGGEKHICLECPYYQMPADGRVKYTRCNLNNQICRKNSDCCEQFYELLFNGEIELKEVMNIETRKSA